PTRRSRPPRTTCPAASGDLDLSSWLTPPLRVASGGGVPHAGRVQEIAPATWEIVERGAWVSGSCRLCGWQSPARRAYATAIREGSTHADSCVGPATRAVRVDGVGVDGEAASRSPESTA